MGVSNSQVKSEITQKEKEKEEQQRMIELRKEREREKEKKLAAMNNETTFRTKVCMELLLPLISAAFFYIVVFSTLQL